MPPTGQLRHSVENNAYSSILRNSWGEAGQDLFEESSPQPAAWEVTGIQTHDLMIAKIMTQPLHQPGISTAKFNSIQEAKVNNYTYITIFSVTVLEELTKFTSKPDNDW